MPLSLTQPPPPPPSLVIRERRNQESVLGREQGPEGLDPSFPVDLPGLDTQSLEPPGDDFGGSSHLASTLLSQAKAQAKALLWAETQASGLPSLGVCRRKI